MGSFTLPTALLPEKECVVSTDGEGREMNLRARMAWWRREHLLAAGKN
jgi:hypothetical protein